MRLNKYLAECGVDSRRNCDNIIKEGRIKVNGKLITEMGYDVNLDNDTVTFDGHSVKPARFSYVMLHKPKGYVTTVKDEKQRKTVMELVSNIKLRLFPVGRLDYDTEGLLLMTNDGDLANKLTHPRHEVSKTYIAKIEGAISEAELSKLRNGFEIDGKNTGATGVELLEYNEEDNTSRIELVIREGRNHQIKKMLEAIEKKVVFLKRSAIGDLKLGGLSRSTYRYLTDKEIAYLKSL